MKNLKILAILVFVIAGSVVLAQPEISPERKLAIDSLALGKSERPWKIY
jgi:hypothetical protein